MELEKPDKLGRRLDYDRNGNLVLYSDNTGIIISKIYDEFNRCIKCKTTTGIEYSREFDDNGNIISYISNQ